MHSMGSICFLVLSERSRHMGVLDAICLTVMFLAFMYVMGKDKE